MKGEAQRSRKQFTRERAASFARLLFSPNGNAITTVFCFSAMAVELVRYRTLSSANGAFLFLSALALVVVLPGVVGAITTVVTGKCGAVWWGLLTVTMLAFLLMALAVRAYGSIFPQIGTVGNFFLLPVLIALWKTVLAERRQ